MSPKSLPPTLRQTIDAGIRAADLDGLPEGRPVVIFSGTNNTNVYAPEAAGGITITPRATERKRADPA
ncbi:hypothetical protein [Roseateles cavernae]|uniref:hypothetical protein n=1 Tax=Roseateles cavernae TaxID=3153578 RepID=UPI0032E50DF2